MVQATDTGKRHNISHLWRFNSPGFRRIFVQRQMRPAGMVIFEIFAKDSTQVPLIENNNMIQAIPAYGPDNSFNERILPRRARGRNDLLDTQALDPSSNLLTVNGIPITQQIAWSGIEWKCFYQLLGRPPCGGMRCNIEVHDVTAVMAEHDKHIREREMWRSEW